MVQEQNEIIGRRLQDVRESAHMDFYDMAKLLRVSVGHYRKIERDEQVQMVAEESVKYGKNEENMML